MRKITWFISLQCISLLIFSQTKVTHPLCENLVNPVAVDARQPRFSWQLVSDLQGISQTAYEIKVTDGKKPFWNSGKVSSDSSVQVTYQGPALESGKIYHWQVRVWDNG